MCRRWVWLAWMRVVLVLVARVWLVWARRSNRAGLPVLVWVVWKNRSCGSIVCAGAGVVRGCCVWRARVSCAVAVYGVCGWHRYSIAGLQDLRVREHASGRACLSWVCVGVSLFLFKSFLYAGAFCCARMKGKQLVNVPRSRGGFCVGTRCGFSRSPHKCR